MFIGFDLGTTNCKAVVLSENGAVLGAAAQEYPVRYPQPGYAEQDAALVWQLAKEVIGAAVKRSGVKEVKALSLSVQGDAVIPVDQNMKPLFPALLGMDYRSLPQARRCQEIFGDKELFALTGMRPHPINSLTKILWVKEERPEIFGKTWKFMTYADFLLGKLGAEPVIDQTMASRTMAFDLLRKDWSRPILDQLAIPAAKLSRPVPSGTAVGKMNARVQEELGLGGDPILVAGGHDQTCAALGAGVIKEGIGVDSSGTAEVLFTAFSQPLRTEEMFKAYYPCYIHAKPDLYCTFALNHTGGVVYQWYRDQFCGEEKREAQRQGVSAYDLINAQMPPQPTKLYFIPHFKGSGSPTCDLDSKGTVFGLTLNTTKGEIAKAILEGLTYELRLNLETMQQAGINIREIIAVGGGAKSPGWLRMKTNITGRPLKILKNKEAAPLGAGILAGVGCGHYRSFEEAVDTMVEVERIYEPDPAVHRVYEEQYEVYRRLYTAVLQLNKEIRPG